MESARLQAKHVVNTIVTTQCNNIEPLVVAFRAAWYQSVVWG
jgi:hypothetical protein